MNKLHLLWSLVIAATVAACSTTMPAEKTGFLSSYAGLANDPENSSASARSSVTIDPDFIKIGEIEWRAEACTHISVEERNRLLGQLREDLYQSVRAMPRTYGGRPAIVRAAITRVEAVSPLLNGVATVLLIGPLDRGGAAVEIEAVDPPTGQQLAALTQGYWTPLQDFNARFSRLAPAQIALRKMVADFALLLQPAAQTSAKTP